LGGSTPTPHVGGNISEKVPASTSTEKSGEGKAKENTGNGKEEKTMLDGLNNRSDRPISKPERGTPRKR